MGKKTGKSLMPGKKGIGLMVVQGFGLFLTVTGMVGLALILGPLNSIIGIEIVSSTVCFGSKLYAALICLLLTVIGGAMDFLAKAGLKSLEK